MKRIAKKFLQPPSPGGQRGIVLGGGAARGAYQLGVWKILRRHGFSYDGFCGTSVGALNATFMAQDDFDAAMELYDSIRLRDVLILPRSVENVDISKLSFREMVSMYSEIIKNGGLDSTPLLQLIRKYTNEKKIRKSGVDLGLVTFKIPQFKPQKLFMDDIEDGMLAEYLYASASVPLLFKSAKIEKQRFTDGGVTDNLPAAMLQERGYRDLTLVDISGTGVVHKPRWENHRILYIKNSRELPNMMDFSQPAMAKSRRMGELDSRKILGELRGVEYFIDLSKDSDKLISKLSADTQLFPAEIFPEELQGYRPLGLTVLECAARGYGVEDLVAYTVDELMESIRARNTLLDRQLSQQRTREEHLGGVNLNDVKNALWAIARDKMGDSSILRTHPPILWLKGAILLVPKYAGRIQSVLKMLYPEIDVTYKFAVRMGLEKSSVHLN